MKPKMLVTVIAVKAAILLIALSPSLPAQSIWLNRSENRTISLEIFKPDFEGDSRKYTFATSALFLSFRVPVGESTFLIAELPFAHGDYDYDSYFYSDSESQSTLGNPYLGLEIGGKNSSCFGEVGIRLPLASEENGLASSIGEYADIDRLEAFSPNWVTFLGMVNYYAEDPSGSTFRLRAGPVFLVNTDNNSCRDGMEVLLSYSAQAGYNYERISFIGGLTGKMIVTEPELDFSERTLHQLGFNTSLDFGSVRPGVHFRLPLDEDLREVFNYVFGLNLEFPLE